MGGGSRHGRFRHVAALALASVVVVVSAAPASGIIDPTEQCWTISGTVMDPYSRAVPGALIATSRGCDGPVGVVSNSTGNYSFSASGNLLGASVAITISKSGFTQQDKYVSASAIRAQSNGSSEMESSSASASNAGGVLDPDDVVDTNDVVLQYDAGAVVTPALRSGETLVLSARNPAPPATGSSTPGAHVRVDLPDGSTQQLVAGTTDTEGFTTWTGSYAVPTTAAEGSYAAVFCVVEQSFVGSCAQAQQVHDSGTNVLVSPLQTKIYIVDNTAPVVAETFPQRFRTVLAAQPFGASWADSGAGVDPASLELRVDGVLRIGSITETSITLSASAMDAGIHVVDLAARDRAGNVAEDRFIFTLADLSADDTTATVDCTTQSCTRQVQSTSSVGGVSLAGKAVFTDVQVDIGQFEERLTASTWAGWGDIHRDFELGEATVVFRNATTGLETPKTIQLPAATASHSLSVLAPSADPLTTNIPADVTTLPTFEVEAPAGYTDESSSARLEPKVGPVDAGPYVLAGQAFLQNTLKGKVLLTGGLGACFDDNSNDPVFAQCFQDQGRDDEGSYQEVLTAQIGPSPQVTLAMKRAQLESPVDQSPERDPSYCTNGAVGASDSNGCLRPSPGTTEEKTPNYSSTIGIVFGCPDYAVAGVPVNLCLGSPSGDGWFSAWHNSFVYRTKNDTAPIWQQSHIDMPELGDICPNGSSAVDPANRRVKSKLYRAAANLQSYDGDPRFAAAGTTAAPTAIHVYLGRRTGTLTAQTAETALTDQTSRLYLISTRNPGLELKPWNGGGAYELDLSGTIRDGFGRKIDVSQLGGAASNAWESTGAAGFERAWDSPTAVPHFGRFQLVAGADFTETAPAGLRRASGLTFQVEIDYSDCAQL